MRSFPKALAYISACISLFAGAACADGLVGTPTTVVASRGGSSITLADVDAFAQKIPEDKRGGFFDSPVRIQKMIDNLLMSRQLATEARTSGLDKQPVVERQLQLASDEVLAAARRQQFEQDVQVPDLSALAQEEFIAHKEKYVQRGDFVVEHILIKVAGRSDDEARALAQTVEKQARANPDNFEALVEQYSDDQSKAANHGKVEDAGNTRLYDPSFAAAAAKLHKPGEISPVVKSTFGYHVIKLIRRTPDKTPSFADVKDRIVGELRAAYVEKTVRGHTDDLRNMPMDTNAELLESLRSRYGTGVGSVLGMPPVK